MFDVMSRVVLVPVVGRGLGVAVSLRKEMDDVLLLKWPGDNSKNTTGRITQIEGGGQEIGSKDK